MKEWKYTVSKNGRHQISEVVGGNVCMIWNCKDKERNANLIAAAPEMYDMLQSIENDADQIPPFLWDKIQAVLAKARGEQLPPPKRERRK